MFGILNPFSEIIKHLYCVTVVYHVSTDGHHVISRIETHLSDGSTQVSTHLTPETAQLLSRLHPNMFPAGCLLPVCINHVLCEVLCLYS